MTQSSEDHESSQVGDSNYDMSRNIYAELEKADGDQLGHAVSKHEGIPEASDPVEEKDKWGEHAVRQAWRNVQAGFIYVAGFCAAMLAFGVVAAAFWAGYSYVSHKVSSPEGAKDLVYAGLKFIGIASTTLVGSIALSSRSTK